MGFFTSTFTHTHTTTLLPQSPPPPEPSITPDTTTSSEVYYQAALSLLHDPSAIITLNPLVTDFEEIDPSTIDVVSLFPTIQDATSQEQRAPQRRYFLIQDSKPLLFGLHTTKFSYHISYRYVDGLGCDTVVAAPSGVSIQGKWRVQRGRGD